MGTHWKWIGEELLMSSTTNVFMEKEGKYQHFLVEKFALSEVIDTTSIKLVLVSLSNLQMEEMFSCLLSLLFLHEIISCM